MATIRLIPSTYAVSSTDYLSVSDASNMYTNTDSTTYATITNTNASTSSRYLYIRGFNFSSIPSNAIINSFTVKIKGYESGLATSTSYAPRLANGTSALSNTTATTNFGTSASTITIPTGALTWQQISTTYGSSFTIMVYVRRNNKNTTGYFYCYGAEILVDYSVPIFHTITSSTNSGTISPSGSTSVQEGEDYNLLINVTNPSITDNGVDVTSQLERITGGTEVLIPYDSESSGFTISNLSNAYSDISDSSYADCSLAGRTTGNLYLDLGPLNLPSNATISSVSCQFCFQVSRNGSSSSMTSSCQLYTGSTAKGSSYTIVSSAADVAKTTVSLTTGTWSASELANARLYITMYNGASSTVRHIYVYGVSFSVTYSVSGEVYTYTISNVTADHTIVVSVGSTTKIYLKVNGTWTQYSKVYQKVNGSWVEVSDPSTLFNTNANYVKGN